MRDVLVPEVLLNRSRVVPVVGEFVAGRVPIRKNVTRDDGRNAFRSVGVKPDLNCEGGEGLCIFMPTKANIRLVRLSPHFSGRDAV